MTQVPAAGSRSRNRARTFLCPAPQTDPIEFVENICENMQLFPKPDLLTADQLMFHYDPEVSRPARF